MNTVFASFTPNMQKDDLKLAANLLLNPFSKTKKTELQLNLEQFFNSKVYLTDSGRTGLYRLLKAYNFAKGSEIIVQSLTCSVVSNSIIQAGLKPIYADISTTNYNPTKASLEKMITSKTKAVIIQHTFGIPAPIKEIKDLCKEKKLILIEDLAISLGSNYKGKTLGSFGDSGIFSFGSAKVLSSSRGGGIFCRNQEVNNTLSQQQTFPFPKIDTTRHLLKILGFALGKKTYSFAKFGKILLYVGNKIKLWPRITNQPEKNAQAKITAYDLSPKLATIAYNQWLKRKNIFAHRKNITKIYQSYFPIAIKDETLLMSYPIQVHDRSNVLKELKKHKIYLDNWYQTPISPADANLTNCQYQIASCPNAEKVSRNLITLPLHPNISPKVAKQICEIINKVKNKS